jgi:cytochrome c556
MESIMLKKILIASALCLVAAGSLASAADLGEQREATMKSIGGAMGAMGKIAKGISPYDAAVVKTSLTKINTSIKHFPSLFPEGSQTGKGAANPTIWQNKADFEAHAAKLASDSEMLLAQLPADKDAVGAAMGQLGKDCGACHQLYRLKK